MIGTRWTAISIVSLLCLLLHLAVVRPLAAVDKPFVEGRFQGRIAYSCDGNHNDPDDWAASPMAFAILAESGLKDRLVHFDYNSILPLTDKDWEKKHTVSVLAAVDHYGFDPTRFFDDRIHLNGAIDSIAKAINESSAENPLYFIIAGPMEVPYYGIQKSDPSKRQFVYCISHSRWNDGYHAKYKYTFNKRSVIEQDVHWVQIRDQNPLLSYGRYGRPSTPDEFKPYFWMRDSADPKVQLLWEHMLVSTRPDPSDAGMMWFLVKGDEHCDPSKLKQLLEDHRPIPPILVRKQLRLEAENFRHLESLVVDTENDRKASHGLSVGTQSDAAGHLRTRFDEPFAAFTARYDVEVRYKAAGEGSSRFGLLINNALRGEAWSSTGADLGWQSHILRDVDIKLGDEIRVNIDNGQVDFVQLNAPGTSVGRQ